MLPWELLGNERLRKKKIIKNVHLPHFRKLNAQKWHLEKQNAHLPHFRKLNAQKWHLDHI